VRSPGGKVDDAELPSLCAGHAFNCSARHPEWGRNARAHVLAGIRG
jgi:hypothetical protein